MNKIEFLKQLENSLSFGLSKEEIAKQINYYDDYISNEVKNGKSEKDVLDEIGDPILIAKTIKQITVASDNINEENNSSYNNYYNNDYTKNYDNDYNNDNNVNNTNNNYGRVYSSSGLGCALSSIITLIVVFFLMKVLGFVVSGVLYFFGPLAIFIIILLFILFGRR